MKGYLLCPKCFENRINTPLLANRDKSLQCEVHGMLDYSEISANVVTENVTEKSKELLKKQYKEYCETTNNPVSVSEWLAGLDISICKYLK